MRKSVRLAPNASFSRTIRPASSSTVRGCASSLLFLPICPAVAPRPVLPPCGVPWNTFPAVAYNATGYGVVAWLRTRPTSQDKSGTDNAIQAVTVSPAGKIGRVLTITPKGNQGGRRRRRGCRVE
jgi:hypothetical protein